MGNALVQQRDPLEEVADFQKQRPTLRPLAETAEGTALAAHRPEAAAASQTVAQLQKEFSGDLGVMVPGEARTGASATLFMPRGDSATRGLVEDSEGGKSYVVVQSPGADDARQDRLYFATRRGLPQDPPQGTAGPPA
jgi:hypothetical protein